MLPTAFLKIASRWWPHVLIGAVPSFVIAVSTEWNDGASILGMLVGVVVFFVLWVSFLSLPWVQRIGAFPSWDKAFYVARWLRVFTVFVSLIAFWWMPARPFASIDLMAGILSGMVVANVFSFVTTWSIDTTNPFMGVFPVSMELEKFLSAVTLTVVEGWVLGIVIAMMGFALWVLGAASRLHHAPWYPGNKLTRQ